LIKWSREVGKLQGFFIVIKKSDASKNEKKGKVLLNCGREGTYRNINVKTHDKDKSEQQGSRATDKKNCNCLFLLRNKKLSN